MDALQFFLIRHGPMHASGERLFEGLTEDQIRRRPHPGVNSIAWLLWHMARVEDMAVHRLVAGRPQLFNEADWSKRLGVPRRDVGTAMTAEQVTELSMQLDLDGVVAYWRAVGERTTSLVQALRPEELDEVNDAHYVRAVCAEDGSIVDAAGWVIEYIEGKSKGLMLSQMALTHPTGHVAEAGVVRALYGFPGR